MSDDNKDAAAPAAVSQAEPSERPAHWFKKGDPRLMVGRPKGLPNKVNRGARHIFEAAQEQVAKRVLALTEPYRDGEHCPLCGAGERRPEELVLKASAEVMDRGGTPRVSAVEMIEKPDTEWLEYATDEEAQQVLTVIEACRARMPINAQTDPPKDQEADATH